MRKLRIALLITLIAMLTVSSTALAAGAQNGAPDTYIIVFRDGVAPGTTATDMARAHGLTVNFVYRYALNGMAAVVPAGRLNALQNDPRVAYIEPDQIISIDVQETPTGIDRAFATGNPNITIDGNDDLRIDVDVAVIDTGVDFDHPDLNVVSRTDCSGGGPNGGGCTENAGDDGNGHGTHVAGTIGAIDNGVGVVGVAPGARIWAVKVLGNNGSGYLSWIAAGIDWVTANADQIEVANMSLGCECQSDAMDQAITSAVNAGVVMVVAAGNSAADAKTHSPANHPDVITVSALADFDGLPGGLGSATCRSDEDDTLANFSNYGDVVEIAAPGVCILSTWKSGGYNTISGTSMASPHVAGAAALLASGANDPQNKSDVAAIARTLINSGNNNWTDDSGDGTKEPLLDVSNFSAATVPGSGGGGGGNVAPTAAFSFSTTGLTATFTDQSSDSDGSITAWNWDFGDGGTSTAQNPTHTYTFNGSYTVSLTVIDDGGASDTAQQTVTVSDGTGSSILLLATGYKVKGRQKADLAWSGANGADVDIYRDGVLIATTANNGAYTDNIDARGGGSYTYRVCEAGTTTCSNEFTITF